MKGNNITHFLRWNIIGNQSKLVLGNRKRGFAFKLQP